MTIIQLLDEQTINQIAAGEVIEHPASVVKELVENALDAGATRIFVEMKAGGQELICVQDNGCGMSEEDVKRSILRHATSKIRASSDLSSLTTMGFRGEALSSIASISKLLILTATHASTSAVQKAYLLESDGGTIVNMQHTTGLGGTKIEVKDLFYNVPARKKFQKSPAKDSLEVVKLMTEMALANPDIEFELIINQKREFFLKPATLEARVAELFGHDFASSLKPLKVTIQDYTFTGFIGDASASRPNRSRQHLFINKRAVSSFSLSYAVKAGYGTMLDQARHPAFILHLSMKPELVDVNVHPQKKEVRLRQESEIKSALSQAVEETLFPRKKSPPIAPQTHFSPIPSPLFSYERMPAKKEDLKETYKEETKFFFEQIPSKKAPEATLFNDEPLIHVVGTFHEYLFVDIQGKEGFPEQLQREGLLILDCKSALSRIAFEELLEPQEAKISTQKLLMPFFIELPPVEARYITKMLPYLKNFGIEIQEFGKSAFLIEAIPVTIEPSQLEEFIRDIVKEEEEDPAKALRKIAQIAGRNNRRRYPVSVELAREITKRLLRCKEPFICPFGGQVFAVLAKEDIHKKFIL